MTKENCKDKACRCKANEESGKATRDIMPLELVKSRPWMRKIQGGYELDLMLDSGAVTTIMPADTFPGHKPRETEASRRGITYMVANGGEIKNKGEFTVRGVAANGTKMNIIAQASDVTKPLGAAREIVKAGNRIVLDEESSYIENKTTKKRIPITRQNCMFMVTMRIPDKDHQRRIHRIQSWQQMTSLLFTSRSRT